jgi:type IV secretory pathway component VirB8
VLYESSDSVAKAYETILSQINKPAHKTVKVQDIIFLDNANTSIRNRKEALHRNLAKVDFITTENNGQQTIEKSWVTTLSWEYLGTPSSKAAAWANWNGFTVTYYRVDQRNV